MPVLYRFALPALIVLIGVSPVRAQNRAPERDSVVILERRMAPRAGGEDRVLRRIAPGVRERIVIADSADADLRARPRGRYLFRRGEAPLQGQLRMRLDTVLGDGTRFRLHLDSLPGDRMALRAHLDSMRHTFRAFGEEDGPAMRFRMEHRAPRMRMQMRRMRPGGRAFREGAPRIEREVRIERDGDARVIRRNGDEIEVERRGAARRPHHDGEDVEVEHREGGDVRIYRLRRGDGASTQAPEARVERHVIHLDRDGNVRGGGLEGVRVERDADGGLRIYVPPQKAEQESAPAPRPRPRG